MMKRNRFFEWILGENSGTVEKLVNITEMDGEYYYNFESGESCNMSFISPMTKDSKSLYGKVMVEVQDPNTLWTFETIKGKKYRDEVTGETFNIPPVDDIVRSTGTKENPEINSVEGSIKLIPPKNQVRSFDLPNIEDYLIDENVDENETSEVREDVKPNVSFDEVVKEQKPETSVQAAAVSCDDASAEKESVIERTVEKGPVEIIIDKSKKVKVVVSMDISMEIPSKSVYEMISENFEHGSDEFIRYVVSNIETDTIKESLAEAIRNAYSDDAE